MAITNLYEGRLVTSWADEELIQLSIRPNLVTLAIPKRLFLELVREFRLVADAYTTYKLTGGEKWS